MGKPNTAYTSNRDVSKQALIEQLSISTLDHITHIDNLKSILRRGLRSHNNPHQKVDISNREVNARRNTQEPIYHRNIHDYAPLYYNPRNAMLYRNQKEFGSDIVVLGFNTNLLLANDMLFTNGNAANDCTWFSNQVLEDLAEVKWRKVWRDQWYPDDEVKRIMMAEVLIYKKIPVCELEVIFCQSKSVKRYIQKHLDMNGAAVEVAHDIFF